MLPSRPASLSEVFADEGAWQSHLLREPSVFESILSAPVQVEHPSAVASFLPDLSVSSGGLEVLVELQLGESDARHLGQVLRYSEHGSANAVLWLAERIRSEDATILQKWNRQSSSPVVAVEVSTLCLGNSNWTLLPRVVTGQPAVGGAEQKAVSARELDYERYWAGLFDAAEARGLRIFDPLRPTRQKRCRVAVIRGRGIYYTCSVTATTATLAVEIDSGRSDFDAAVFDQLVQRRAEIERSLEEYGLVWVHPEQADSGSGLIVAQVQGGYSLDREKSIAAAVDFFGRLHAALTPILEAMPWSALLATQRGADRLFS